MVEIPTRFRLVVDNLAACKKNGIFADLGNLTVTCAMKGVLPYLVLNPIRVTVVQCEKLCEG